MKKPFTMTLVNLVVLGLMRVLCTLRASRIESVPQNGPAILLSNHTSLFEGPIYYALLWKQNKTAIAKRELWDNWATRFLMQVWGIIPIDRHGSDRRAVRRAMNALKKGAFLGIAPEGTRSKDGCLLPGKPGAAMIAYEAGVPIIPLAHWGMRDIPKNARRLRRTRVHVAVGAPFVLHLPYQGRPKPQDLRKMTEEMMFQLATLMPEELRGAYKDLSRMSTDYIRPIEL